MKEVKKVIDAIKKDAKDKTQSQIKKVQDVVKTKAIKAAAVEVKKKTVETAKKVSNEIKTNPKIKETIKNVVVGIVAFAVATILFKKPVTTNFTINVNVAK